MKTARENGIIERLLPHIAAAFNETEKMDCTMSYDSVNEIVLIDCSNGKHLEVCVAGDSPLAVIYDVTKQLYCQMI